MQKQPTFLNELSQFRRFPTIILRDTGHSRAEILVGLAILGVAIAIGIPAIFEAVVYRHGFGGTQVLSNMKQLQVATRQMVLDGETAGDNSLGWPGDTGGMFSNWVRQMVPAYLGTNDFCKLLSAPGVIVRTDKFPMKMNKGAVIAYAVSSNSPPDTVLFSSANFTNSPQGGTPLHKSAKPFGKRGFVIFRKGGDGAVLMSKYVGETNLIGDYAPPLK